MATTQPILSPLLILISSVSLLLCLSSGHSLKCCGFDHIYQLGDSLADTGNLIREFPNGPLTPYGRPPYGETIGKATGRCSNGLLMIDYFGNPHKRKYTWFANSDNHIYVPNENEATFLAIIGDKLKTNSSGLPFINPYLEKDADFRNGVNFAVAGATALTVEFLAGKLIVALLTTSSLSVQLGWMSRYFSSTCSTNKDCREKLKQSLFIVGEIGENEFNYALVEGRNIEEVRSLVPDMVKVIKDAVTTVIRYGAVRVIVPGIWALGCFPIFLTLSQTTDTSAYDKNGCLKQINDVSMYFNNKLQEAIHELKEEFPNTFIAYGDYYNAFLQLFNNATALGIDIASILKSCCGIGGNYNFNLVLQCGSIGVPVCSNPNSYIHWDGIHLTQAAYKFMARWLIDDILPNLGCNT